MNPHIKKLLTRGLPFLLAVGVLWSCLIQIITPKYLCGNRWPSSSTFLGFYQMKKNTVDVLLLGSSVIAQGFSPQEAYDLEGFTSYNLSSERQEVNLSYFWLEEALKYQTPRVVVLECFRIFAFEPSTEDAYDRKALDFMKWSSNKWSAVQALSEQKEQNPLSYVFPNIRYHERWKSLNEIDFTQSERASHYESKGYIADATRVGDKVSFTPFIPDTSAGEQEILPELADYLDKITQLCQERGISLVLVSFPTYYQTVKYHNAISRYAAEHDLTYLDFNTDSLYREIGYDFSVDQESAHHANFRGAQKLTAYLSSYLSEKFYLQTHMDKQYETTRDYAEFSINSITLHEIGNIVSYLEMIRDDRYTVFIAARNEAARSINRDIISALHKLGLTMDLTGQYGYSYLAVISQGKILEEQLGNQMLSAKGVFRNHHSSYTVTSAGYECGDTCSIVIDGVSYARNKRGLNIVVYDNILQKVVDSVCFDTYDEALTAYR